MVDINAQYISIEKTPNLKTASPIRRTMTSYIDNKSASASKS